MPKWLPLKCAGDQPLLQESYRIPKFPIPPSQRTSHAPHANLFSGLRSYRRATATQQRSNPRNSSQVALPPDFDWQAYLDYNTDIRAFGVNSMEFAAGHYLSYGYKERRVYKRIPLVVRYTACGGLMNQHYSHLAAITLAVALGADVILPAAVRRDSFAHYFSADPKRNEVEWTPVPFETLWDMHYITDYLQGTCC